MLRSSLVVSSASTAVAIHLNQLKKSSLEISSNPVAAGTDLDEVKKEYVNATEAGTLHQDGFSFVDCVTDELLATADKHGPGKLNYNPNTPISIVRYADVAQGNAADEAAGMTRNKCFQFCRRLEHMHFFGLVNGGNCYCSPFYRATGGKSETCSVPCEGDSSEMCGGTTKSAVFEMHDCDTPARFSLDALASFSALARELEGSYSKAKLCSDDLAHFGQLMANAAGKNGNQIAMEHQQDMIASQKQFASTLKGLPFDSIKIVENLDAAIGAYSAAGSSAAAAAEEARTTVSSAVDAADEALPVITTVAEKCQPPHPIGSEPASEGASKYYHSVTGIDFAGSCAGNPILPVRLSVDAAACAEVCRSTIAPTRCAGYQVYSSPAGVSSCELFSSFTSLNKYTKPISECSADGVSGQCFVPITDETTYTLLEKSAHMIDSCF